MSITPIRTGRIRCNKTVLTQGNGYDQVIDIPSTAWLVEHNGSRILVDTGMCDTEHANQYHYPGSVQADNERIDRALAARGITPDEISLVILTHLHWDHSANLHLFKAPVVVQRDELAYAKAPSPPYFRSYESTRAGLKPSYERCQIEVVHGDYSVMPGIQVLATCGHSAGHQSVVVDGRDARYVIAGDACMCRENLLPDRRRGTDLTMIGRYLHADHAWESLVRVKNAGDVVLPGHDAAVFERETYF